MSALGLNLEFQSVNFVYTKCKSHSTLSCEKGDYIFTNNLNLIASKIFLLCCNVAKPVQFITDLSLDAASQCTVTTLGLLQPQFLLPQLHQCDQGFLKSSLRSFFFNYLS